MITVSEFAKQLKISIIDAKSLLQGCGIYGKVSDSVLTEKEILLILNKTNEMNEKSSTSSERNLEVLFGDDTRTFIDTNILLADNFYDFWDKLEPIVIKHRSINVNRLPIIPWKVCEELKKMAMGEKDNRSEKAEKVLRYIRTLKDKQLVKIMGTDSDNFADNVFKTIFTQYRLKYKMILITQDKGLTEDILQLNNSKADRAFKVKVFKLKKDSDIVDAAEATKGPKRPSYETEAPLFEIKRVPISRKDEIIQVKERPREGDTVYTSKGAVKLVSTISETGGEGIVYKTENGDVCKIYHHNKLSLNRKAKIELMVKNKINYEGICWPTEAVYNSHKEFVGYIMPAAKGTELKNLFLKPLLAKNFPDWTKKEMVQLSITILEKICYLHHHNIILGDINPRNILVVSPKEVYFVDCDSYQLNKYPCEVDMPHFRAPELIGKDMSKQMRTFGNESFAIATLLFMIMIPGKPPYAQTGSGTPEEDIAKMVFAYPKGAEKKGIVAPGQWRYCWSHLSYDLKEAFYNTFQGGEIYCNEEDRLSSKDWLEKMKKYRFILDKLIENDEQSGWLFPTDFKKHPSLTASCSVCGKAVKEEDLTEGYCKSCLQEGEIYHCGRCKKEMVYSNFQKHIKKKPKYNECYECRQALDSVVKEIECQACGENFDFTLGEKEYYEAKNYEEPKRCQTCRDNNIPIKSYSKGGNNSSDNLMNKGMLDALKGIWAKFK